MAPIVHGLEYKYRDQINFVYLDIDNPRSNVFKRELGYRVQPHFFLIDGEGNVIQQWVGIVSEETLSSTFDQAFIK